MKGVQAVACDMNSDFRKRSEKCPHEKLSSITSMSLKNFNDKVISEIQRTSRKRLLEEGKVKAANMLKGSYHLPPVRKGLRSKDKAATEKEGIPPKGHHLQNRRGYLQREAGRKGTMLLLRGEQASVHCRPDKKRSWNMPMHLKQPALRNDHRAKGNMNLCDATGDNICSGSANS